MTCSMKQTQGAADSWEIRDCLLLYFVSEYFHLKYTKHSAPKIWINLCFNIKFHK